MSTNAKEILYQQVPAEHRAATAFRLALVTTLIVVGSATVAYFMGYVHALRAQEKAAEVERAKNEEFTPTPIPTPLPPNGQQPQMFDTLPKPPPSPIR